MGQRRSRIVAAKDLRRGGRQGAAFTVGVEGEGREQVGSVCGGARHGIWVRFGLQEAMGEGRRGKEFVFQSIRQVKIDWFRGASVQ